MPLLLAISRTIDAFNARVGRAAAWLVVAAILISATNAIIRKLFDTSSNAWLELQWVLFGAVFLLCAPWTLRLNEHIRIDVAANRLSKRTRDWIEIVGHVFFLLPIAAVMVVLSWPFFLRSAPAAAEVWSALGGLVSTTPWRGIAAVLGLGEQSSNSGGLPVWPAKFLVPLGFALLFLQGLSELIRRAAIMAGKLDEPVPPRGHVASAEAESERLRAVIGGDQRAAAKTPPTRTPLRRPVKS